MASQATYVYGILPEDVELSSEMEGTGDPPGQVRLVHSDGLTALVSDVNPDNPLGSPRDLTSHKEVLDATAAAAPVLPLRFGAVLASDDAVIEELLRPYDDEFTAALRELEGRVQYVVKGRYAERAILEEVLSENPQAQRLRQEIQGQDPDATRDLRMNLGEMVNEAVERKRERDTRALGDALAGHCVASAVREPTHERDAAHVALLVDESQEQEMRHALEALARKWEGRADLRLLGPMAAYDFVATTQPEG
jgi:gas vesicle protein GvpL/GvpF